MIAKYIFGLKPFNNVFINSYIVINNYAIAYYPKGTIIFRGLNEDEIDIKDNKYPTWFASYSTAYEYNENVKVYKLIKDVFLLVLSDNDNLNQLLNDMKRLNYIGRGNRSNDIKLKDILYHNNNNIKLNTQKLFQLTYGLNLTVNDKNEIIEALRYDEIINDNKNVSDYIVFGTEGFRMSEYETDKLLFNDLCHFLSILNISVVGTHELYDYKFNRTGEFLTVIKDDYSPTTKLGTISGFVSSQMPRMTIIPKDSKYRDYNIFYEEAVICQPNLYLEELNETNSEYQEIVELGKRYI